jgi:hypothetical protein
VKTTRDIRGFLEQLGAKVEDHKRTSLGPSQTKWNADWLDAHVVA